MTWPGQAGHNAGATPHKRHRLNITFITSYTKQTSLYRKNWRNKFLSRLICLVKEFPQKFELMRYLVTLNVILSGELHILLYHESET